MTEPHLRELPLRIGGVMRCCIETLDTTPVEEKEGDILPCKYCSSSLRVREGAWEWNYDPEPAKPVETQPKPLKCLTFFMIRDEASGKYYKRGYSYSKTWVDQDKASVWTDTLGPRSCLGVIKRRNRAGQKIRSPKIIAIPVYLNQSI